MNNLKEPEKVRREKNPALNDICGTSNAFTTLQEEGHEDGEAVAAIKQNEKILNADGIGTAKEPLEISCTLVEKSSEVDPKNPNMHVVGMGKEPLEVSYHYEEESLSKSKKVVNEMEVGSESVYKDGESSDSDQSDEKNFKEDSLLSLVRETPEYSIENEDGSPSAGVKGAGLLDFSKETISPINLRDLVGLDEAKANGDDPLVAHTAIPYAFVGDGLTCSQTRLSKNSSLSVSHPSPGCSNTPNERMFPPGFSPQTSEIPLYRLLLKGSASKVPKESRISFLEDVDQDQDEEIFEVIRDSLSPKVADPKFSDTNFTTHRNVRHSPRIRRIAMQLVDMLNPKSYEPLAPNSSKERKKGSHQARKECSGRR